MIKAEDHQRVGIGEHALVERQSLPGLIDALEDVYRLARGLADDILKADDRRWNSSSVPAIPCRNIFSEYSLLLLVGHPTRRTSVIVEKRLSISVMSRFASHG